MTKMTNFSLGGIPKIDKITHKNKIYVNKFLKPLCGLRIMPLKYPCDDKAV